MPEDDKKPWEKGYQTETEPSSSKKPWEKGYQVDTPEKKKPDGNGDLSSAAGLSQSSEVSSQQPFNWGSGTANIKPIDATATGTSNAVLPKPKLSISQKNILYDERQSLLSELADAEKTYKEFTGINDYGSAGTIKSNTIEPLKKKLSEIDKSLGSYLMERQNQITNEKAISIAEEKARERFKTATTVVDDAQIPGTENTPIKIDNKDVAIAWMEQTQPTRAKTVLDKIAKTGDEEAKQQLEATGIGIQARDASAKMVEAEEELSPAFFDEYGAAQKTLVELMPLVESGEATEEQQEQYQVAYQAYTELRANPSYQRLAENYERRNLLKNEYNTSSKTAIPRFEEEAYEKRIAAADSAYKEMGYLRKGAYLFGVAYDKTVTGLYEDLVSLPRTLASDGSYNWTEKLAEHGKAQAKIISDNSPLPTNIDREFLEDIAKVGDYEVVLDDGNVVAVKDADGFNVTNDIKEKVIGQYDPEIHKTETAVNKAAGAYQTVQMGLEMGLSLLPIAGLGGKVATTLGATEKLSGVAGMTAGITVQMHNDAYNAALDAGASPSAATAYALMISGQVAAISFVNPMEARLASRLAGTPLKSSASEFVSQMNMKGLGVSMKDALIQGGKTFTKDAVAEGLEEVFETPAQDLTQYAFNNMGASDFEIKTSAKDYITAFVLGAAGGGMFSTMEIKTRSKLAQEQMSQVLDNLPQVTEELQGIIGKEMHFRDGVRVFTEADALRLSLELQELKSRTESIIGETKLDDRQKIKVAELVRQKISIEAVNAKPGLDDVIVKKNKEKIGEINNQIELLLDRDEGEPYFEINGKIVDEAEFKRELTPENIQLSQEGKLDLVAENAPEVEQELMNLINNKDVTENQERVGDGGREGQANEQAGPVEGGSTQEVETDNLLQGAPEITEQEIAEFESYEAALAEFEKTYNPQVESINAVAKSKGIELTPSEIKDIDALMSQWAYQGDNRDIGDAIRFIEYERSLEVEETNDFSNLTVEEKKTKAKEFAQNYIDAMVEGVELDPVDDAIRSAGVYTTQESFNRFGDRNITTGSIAKTYFGKKGDTAVRTIDQIAQEASDYLGKEVTTDDVVQFMLNNPTGVPRRSESAIKAAMEYKAITGKKLNRAVADKVVSGENKSFFKDVEKSIESGISWLDDLDKQLAKFGKENMGSSLPVPVLREAIKVAKVALKTFNSAVKAVEAAIEYLRDTDWYESLTEEQKKNAEKELEGVFTGETDISTPPKTTVQKKIDKATGVVKPRGKMVRMTEKTGLKKQVRDFARGVREGVKAQKDISSEVENLLRGLVRSGTLKAKQAAAIAKKALKVNYGSPKSVSRFLNYADKVFADAEYDESLKNARASQNRAKKLAKSDKVAPNHREALAGIVKIPLERVEDINDYNAKVDDYMRTFLPVTNPNYKQGDSDAMTSYVKDLMAGIEEDIAAEIMEEYGIAAEEVEGWTAQEIIDVFSQEDIDAYSSNLAEAKQKQLGDLLTKIVEYSQIALRGFDGFVDSEEHAGMIKKLVAIDPSRLSNEQKRDLVKAIDNIIVNGNYGGVRRIAAVYDAIPGMDKALKANQGNKMKELWNLSAQTYSLGMMMRKVFGLKDTIAQVLEGMGYSDFFSRVTEFHRDMDGVREKMSDNSKSIRKRYKDAFNGENIAARGMYGFVAQFIGAEDMQKQFVERKKMVRDSIDRKLDSKRFKEEGEVEDGVFRQILEGSNSLDEVTQKFKDIYPGSHERWEFLAQNVLPPIKDKSSTITEEFHNQLWDESYENYSPIKYRRIEIDELEDLDKPFFSRGDKPPRPKQSVNTIKRARYHVLPSDRVLDLNLDNNVLDAAYNNLYDYHTSEAFERIRQFLKMPEAIQLFGSKDNVRIISQKIRNVRETNLRTRFKEDEIASIIRSASNSIRKIAIGRALGGFTQVLKQTASVGINTIINLGRRPDLLFRGIANIGAASKLHDKYTISQRGKIKGGTVRDNIIDGFDETVARSLYDKVKKHIGKYVETATDLFLTPLRIGDTAIAKGSWNAYYLKYLADKGYDLKAIDLSTEHEFIQEDSVRRDAATYAEQMTDINQVASEVSKIAEVSKMDSNSYKNLLKDILLPFSTFSIEAKGRIVNDWRDLLSGRDPKNAAKSLTATLAETVAFQAINTFVVAKIYEMGAKGIMALFGIEDDDETPEEVKQADLAFKIKKMYSNVIKDYFVSGLPLMDQVSIDALNTAAYLIFKAADNDVIKKDNGDVMELTPWLKQTERTPFYRYGQWQNGIGYGMPEVAYKTLIGGAGNVQDELVMIMDGESNLTEEEQNFMKLVMLAEVMNMANAMDADVYRMLSKEEKRLKKKADN